MNIWVLDSESGVKLLYKSFLKTKADEDVVSGFLTAFHHFSVIEFNQSLDSIEMGGWRWIYTLEPEYNLLFVAADRKSINTEIFKGRLEVIKKAFIEEFKHLWKKKKGKSWYGNIKVFSPFIKVLEDYHEQWGEVESLAPVADFFDILGVFDRAFIMLRNIIEKKMYSKSRNEILNRVEKLYADFREHEDFKCEPELENINFSKDDWFNIIDINLMKCDRELVIKSLKALLSQVVNILMEVKGSNLCFKYFSEINLYDYIYNNLKLLKDLNLDMFFFEVFLLI